MPPGFDFPTNPVFGTAVSMPDGSLRVWDSTKWHAAPSAGGPFLPLIGGMLTGNLTINYAGVYANENASLTKSALNIAQTMSGQGSGVGNSMGFNNINIADTLDADGPDVVQSSFTGSINGTILTITPPVTGVSQATFSASISGTVMTVSGTVTTGRISAGLTIQWAGGSDIVVSGGPITYVMQHSNTAPLQAMTAVGPVPGATIAWYPAGLDPQTATIQQFSSGNNWILTTDQGIVNSQPMATIKGFVPLQAIGWYYNHLFGGPGTGGSRSGARFQLSMFNGPAPRHANYQSTLSALSLSFPSGGTDLWSGAAGTGWGAAASASLAKRPNVPPGVDNTYGPINYRGIAGMEIDYGVASGSPDDPQYPKASAANVGGLTVIRYGSNQMAPAIWESDYGFALGQIPSGLKDAGGNIVPAKAAKFGFRFGSQSLDQLNGRAIGVQIARNAYLADGTADPTLTQTRHGVDWTPWDLTGTLFRGRGFSVLGSSGPFTAGAVQVGGGYLSANNTAVSLDTVGSVCTGAAIAPGQGGAVLYPRLVLIHDDTGTMAIVTAVDNAVRPGIGAATTVVLVPNTGRAHSSQIPTNPVQFRATGNPITFPAPGPTGPKLNLTWTAPTTLALQPSGGTTTFGGPVTLPSGTTGPFLPLATGGTVAGATTFSSTLAFGSGAAIGTLTGNIATPKLDITGSGTNIGYQINTKGTGSTNIRYLDIGDNANGQGVFDNTTPLNVHWNPTFSGSSSGNAISANTAMAGTLAAGQANVYQFNVGVDSVNASAGGGLSNLYAGISVTGSTAQGHRNGVVGYVNVTAVTGNTTGPGVFFTGIVGRGEASAPDTSSQRNALFGALLASRLNSAAATGWGGQTGLEIDVSSIVGSSVKYKIGMQIVREAFDAVQGSLFDCAFGIASQVGASAGWLQGISFGEPNGVWGMDPLSTLIGSHTTALGGPAYLAASGIDFSGITFSTAFLKSVGFSVDGSGNAAMARAGFNGTAPIAKPVLTGSRGGILNTPVASVGNGADLTEDTLQTFSIPANTLRNVGDRIRIVSAGTFGPTTDSKILRVKIGGGVYGVISVSTAATTAWRSSVEVVKTGSNAQVFVHYGVSQGLGSNVTNFVSALVDTAALALQVTGQNTTNSVAGSVVCNYLTVEALPATVPLPGVITALANYGLVTDSTVA